MLTTKTCPECGLEVNVGPKNDGVWHWCDDGVKRELVVP